jgi:cytochrome c oxidase subunit 4
MVAAYRIELVALSLMLLAGISWALSHASLGAAAVVVALGIAAIKATLIAVELMELRDAPTSLRLIAIATPLFVLLLVGFAWVDVVSR